MARAYWPKDFHLVPACLLSPTPLQLAAQASLLCVYFAIIARCLCSRAEGPQGALQDPCSATEDSLLRTPLTPLKYRITSFVIKEMSAAAVVAPLKASLVSE